MTTNYLRIIIVAFVIILQHFSIFATTSIANTTLNNTLQDISCQSASNKQTLINGWYLWEPYQFNQLTPNGYILTGMDIELTKAIATQVGVEIKYDRISWNRYQREFKEGKKDMAAGAAYTEDRSQFAYFSIPYRFEENSLFMLMSSEKKLVFNNISEYLAQIREKRFRVGVVRGFIYADAKINEFIADHANSDIISQYENDEESLQVLLRDEIDGFMADRVAGAAVILNNALAHKKIREVPLNIKAPIHFMFSKQTVPLELVDHFNQEIQKFVGSNKYKSIVKNYIYPVLLLQTIDSQWFYLVSIIGTIVFAISGIVIAAKENLTLFWAVLLAMLPSVGGGIMRDIIVNKAAVGILFMPVYMYYILVVVIIGFTAVKLLNYYNITNNVIQKIWSNLLIICDAIGQAAFIVIGVSVVIMMRIEPIELWGPFFAFLTSNGGGILRDLLRPTKDGIVVCVSGRIDAEITVIWGLVFSIFLDINSVNPNPETIEYMVILVTTGAFITKLIVHYLKIPNITIYPKSNAI